MSQLELWLLYVIGPLIAIVSSSVAFVFGRKKAVAETKASELDNTEKAIEIWRKLAEDFVAQLKQRDEIISSMKLQMDMILSQNSELLKQNKSLLSKVNLLEKDLGKLRTMKN